MNKLFIKKKKGEFDTFMIVFLFIFTFMLFTTCLYKRNISLSTVKKTEESLKAATLAGATINLAEYGMTDNIVISDYDTSYLNFKESLISSMGLNDTLSPPENSVIVTPIHINKYIIYNVRGDIVECIVYENDSAVPTITSGTLGSVSTPNNTIITESTVYSQISFEIKGFIKNKTFMGKLFDMDNIAVTKDCLIDITD